MIAGQMGVAESGMGKSLRASGGQVKNGDDGAWESGDVAEERDREMDTDSFHCPQDVKINEK